ncbi:MAG: M1 family aminopeptidase [candidate division Zixibacteria bacterium]|nr:M1 family aminopeptidase [candidate division Zixibacteria bacterium]
MCLRISLVFVLIVLWFFVTSSTFAQRREHNIYDGDNSPTYTRLYESLADLGSSFGDVAEIPDSGFVLKKCAAEFVLEQGRLYLLPSIGGRICRAIFFGRGRFAFQPPILPERQQLKRFYGVDSLNREFTNLYLIFGDSVNNEFKQRLSFVTSQIPSEAKEIVRKSRDYMGQKKGKEIDPDIIKTLLDQRYNKLFYAHIFTVDERPLFYKIDPYAEEQVSLMRRWPEMSRDAREVVCQFSDDSDPGILPSDYPAGCRIDRYNIDCTFNNRFGFSARATVMLRSTLPLQRWFYFSLYPKMEVDSVIWGGSLKMEYFKGDENPYLWVQCPAAISEGQVDSVTIYYHGEIIERQMNWLIFRTSTAWYPDVEDRNRAVFDLTFHTPSDCDFVSVGDLVADTVMSGVRISRWLTPIPIRNASFNIGYFKEYKIQDPRIPPVTVLMSKMGHREIEEALLAEGTLSGKSMEKQVGGDVANSISFFQHIYGNCPVDKFYATEVTDLGGEAFRGLIHLSLMTFQISGREGYDQMLRAHEVAHQWWGYGVDYKTYHDKWLSEGFAEYSGLWYLQIALKDNKKFFDRLNDHRRDILERYKTKVNDDRFVGPISLGYRASSADHPEGFDLMSYEKGAWVLHMLRNLLIDFQTMNEDRFLNMMRDFYLNYSGKEASTEDFRQIVERHVGDDMGWFFDQWVYGIDIPTYKFSYKTESEGDDKYLVTCRIKQLDVPDNFKMYVPVLLDFGKQGTARIRILVDKPEMEITLPPLPYKPDKVKFNDLESVLCKIDTEKWKN